MKVDKNQPAFPQPPTFRGGDYFTTGEFGIPLRLEIAARILASWNSIPDYCASDLKWEGKCALKFADALIEAHNETCGDGEAT